MLLAPADKKRHPLLHPRTQKRICKTCHHYSWRHDGKMRPLHQAGTRRGVWRTPVARRRRQHAALAETDAEAAAVAESGVPWGSNGRARARTILELVQRHSHWQLPAGHIAWQLPAEAAEVAGAWRWQRPPRPLAAEEQEAGGRRRSWQAGDGNTEAQPAGEQQLFTALDPAPYLEHAVLHRVPRFLPGVAPADWQGPLHGRRWELPQLLHRPAWQSRRRQRARADEEAVSEPQAEGEAEDGQAYEGGDDQGLFMGWEGAESDDGAAGSTGCWQAEGLSEVEVEADEMDAEEEPQEEEEGLEEEEEEEEEQQEEEQQELEVPDSPASPYHPFRGLREQVWRSDWEFGDDGEEAQAAEAAAGASEDEEMAERVPSRGQPGWRQLEAQQQGVQRSMGSLRVEDRRRQQPRREPGLNERRHRQQRERERERARERQGSSERQPRRWAGWGRERGPRISCARPAYYERGLERMCGAWRGCPGKLPLELPLLSLSAAKEVGYPACQRCLWRAGASCACAEE